VAFVVFGMFVPFLSHRAAMGFRKLSRAVRAAIHGSEDVHTSALDATLTVA
jgi:hypothetical protein